MFRKIVMYQTPDYQCYKTLDVCKEYILDKVREVLDEEIQNSKQHEKLSRHAEICAVKALVPDNWTEFLRIINRVNKVLGAPAIRDMEEEIEEGEGP